MSRPRPRAPVGADHFSRSNIPQKTCLSFLSYFPIQPVPGVPGSKGRRVTGSVPDPNITPGLESSPFPRAPEAPKVDGALEDDGISREVVYAQLTVSFSYVF